MSTFRRSVIDYVDSKSLREARRLQNLLDAIADCDIYSAMRIISAHKGWWADLQERQTIQSVFALDPAWACQYASYAIEGRWPEAESVIATDIECAYTYARYVLKGRFPQGEPVIATDPAFAYLYASDIIKGRFLEGESAIMKDPYWARVYDTYIVRSFP